MRVAQIASLAASGILLLSSTAHAATIPESEHSEFVPFGLSPDVVAKRQNVPSKCNADNCARAATGTRKCALLPTKHAACKSFQLCTVTPTPVVVTETATQTLAPETQTTQVIVTTETTITVPAGAGKRQASAATPITNCPTEVPTFATACSGTVRYSSACACWGYTRNYTTIAAATSTTTTTVTQTPDPVTVSLTATETKTATVTSTPEPTWAPAPNPTGHFNMRIFGGPYNGVLIAGGTGSNSDGWVEYAAGSGGSYHTFRPVDGTTMYENDYDAVQYRRTSGELGVPYTRGDADWRPVSFQTISKDGGATKFVNATGIAPEDTILQVCPRDENHKNFPWVMLGSTVRSSCTVIEVQLV